MKIQTIAVFFALVSLMSAGPSLSGTPKMSATVSFSEVGIRSVDDVFNRIDNDPDGPIHVIGVCEGIGDDVPAYISQHHPVGDVTVNVSKKPQPITLMLCSSHSVRWNVKLEPGAQIKQIVLAGSDPSEVIGEARTIPTTTFIKKSPDAWGPNVRISSPGFYTYKLPDRTAFPANINEIPERHRKGVIRHHEYEKEHDVKTWRSLFAALRVSTGQTRVSTFQGRYNGTSFNI